MSQRGHRQGGKYTGSHTTVLEQSESLLDAICTLDYVTKITIGIITPGFRRPTTKIKMKPILAGVELIFYGTSACQVFYLYTAQERKDELMREISNLFSSVSSSSAH